MVGRTLYKLDFRNTVPMRCETICSHSLTLPNSAKSGSGVVSLNHGLAGLVTPLIMQERNVLATSVAVESSIFRLRLSPLLLSDSGNGALRGRIQSDKSRQC